MKETFSNLPLDVQIKKKDSNEDSILYFDALNKAELQFKASESDAAIAFFLKRGMEEPAAKSVAFIFRPFHVVPYFFGTTSTCCFTVSIHVDAEGDRYAIGHADHP